MQPTAGSGQLRHGRQAPPGGPVIPCRRVEFDAVVTLLDQGDFRLDTELAKAPARARIRCPHCRWQPERGSRWSCYPAGAPEHFLGGCGTSWNTFDTRGRCPGCSHQWRHTSCLACAKWSLHEDWYEREGDKPDAAR